MALTSSVAIAAPTSALAKVNWDWSSSANYSSGKYGATENTDVTYVPFTVRASSERWHLDVAVPYIAIEGPQGSVSGGVVIPGTGPVESHSGLGDVTVTAGLQLVEPRPGGSRLELGGTVKLPTADEQLGTKETDTSVQLSGQQPLGAGLTAIGSIGYQWYGDPEAYTLDDGPIGSVGVNYATGHGSNVGVVANYRAAYFDDLGEQVMVSPYVSMSSQQGWTLTGYATAGLTDASPDFAVGVMIGRRFGNG
jgi:hypothetical protein